MNEPASKQRIIDCVKQHYDVLVTTGCDHYGPQNTRMWMASLDTRTGQYPQDDTRPEHIPKRVYRNIDAPKGCSLYWDQPAIVGAHALSAFTGDAKYASAADGYVKDFLARCIAHNGLFLWGNHYYYDAFADMTLRFPGSAPPVPVDMANELGDYHEIRPIAPAWESFWRVSEQDTTRHIIAMTRGHLVERESGMFNRHADNRRGCAFLEHGGTIIHAVAWLCAKKPTLPEKDELLAIARAIGQYSYNHRASATGLMENNPTETRWDKHTSTTEAGLWAKCLLDADAMLAQPELVEMADQVMTAWLRYGFDEKAGKYFGRLRVSDGSPVLEPPKTLYEPGNHADLWRPLFPAHDYPMSMAQALLALHRLTQRDVYETACHRWRDMIAASLPARDGQGGYAEHYGRCLHFCLDAATHFTQPRHQEAYMALADKLASEAMQVLWDEKMFRGHPGEHRYDAVDGVGFLSLALLWYATGQQPDDMALSW